LTKRYPILALMTLALVAVVLVGCNAPNGAAATEETGAAIEVTLGVTEEVDPGGTEEPTASETEESVATEEALATEEVGLPPVDLDNPLPPNSADGAFSIAPHSLDFEEGANTEDAPEGYRHLLVTASVNNDTTESIFIEEDEINLIGDDGQRYAPVGVVDAVQPQLIGFEIEPDSSVLAAVLFALPPDVQPSLLEWCPLGACEGLPLQVPLSSLPLSDDG
jgi:hypothetical protein